MGSGTSNILLCRVDPRADTSLNSNLASVYGSFIWPSQDAPRYIMGFAVMTSFMFIAGLVALVIKKIWDDKGLERIDYKAQDEARK